ncbi:WD repeat protein [Drechmeria coniospora]|uniref:WD repeat protein n=1 Tax=Drechmeria coniospora TaxID=98403 RepID=A0A151GBN4_DRECN|nr:WD repeat protein [Drechmeria coniospora]KYK54519.1 WD repeat protein [Drechmeria coniospora]
MAIVLPGKPQSSVQGLATGLWQGRHLNVYTTGGAFTILDGPQTVLQTVYNDDDDEHQLEAIAIDEASGKVAVCSAEQVRIYQPVNSVDGDNPKWTRQAYFEVSSLKSAAPCSLSWGSSEELLVGNTTLSLFATKTHPPTCSWIKSLPNPVMTSIISYDSAYIASVSHHDRLPKVWRRLTYGPDEVRFDMTYLRHPDIVTSIRWRKPYHLDQTVENVLYTVCLDFRVRIWTAPDASDGRYWRLWGQVDLHENGSGIPTSPSCRFVCIIDGRDFTTAVESAAKDRMASNYSTDDVALDYVVAIARKNPEICLAFYSNGGISAWALENVGKVSRSSGKILNIADVQVRQIESISSFLKPFGNRFSHIQVETYCGKPDGRLYMLLHVFDGRVGVFTGDVADLLDPTHNDKGIALQTVWSGHSAPIKKIVRNFSGRAIVSRTAAGEAEIAAPLARCAFQISGTPLCLIILPRPDARKSTTAHVAMITSDRQGIVWEANLPHYLDDPAGNEGAAIFEFCRFELNMPDSLKYVLPVDPAGSLPVTSDSLDVFARDIAMSYTWTGRVDLWTARIDPSRRCVDWLSTCSTETGLTNPALASGSMLKKAALVNSARSQLTIWDIGGSRLEYEQNYKLHDEIQDLDWTSTPDSQSILAVGFQYRVILVSQMRFDYLNKGPAWAPIREISTRPLTPHPIGDSTWLGDGHLVVGAGNQLFIYDRHAGSVDSLIADFRTANRRDGSWDLFQAVQRFNGPIPLFHPQFLSQCILAGKSFQVRQILAALHKTLKYLIPGEAVDDYLGLDLQDFHTMPISRSLVPGKAKNSYLNGTYNMPGVEGREDEVGDATEIFSEQMAVAINERLLRIGIPQLTGHEQIQLADMVECVALVEQHRRSMDENAARFMLFYRQNSLRKGQTGEALLSWREINWAYHSSSQDLLADFVSRQAHGQMLWHHARGSGIFMWLSDVKALRAQFEIIAQNEYIKTEEKNPVHCSLFYLALRKKTVLQRLWRMASWNREQAATQRLLSNNFDDPKWQRAALKNAYALLGKRRFEYAAAFFLLADHLEDAAEVCLKQLKDLQLAVAITRAYEGDGGPILCKLLQDEVLPLAAQEGNRWLASWAFWMLGRRDMAVRALVMPVYALLETPSSPDIKSRLFLTDDPALVVLYSQLRQQTLQTLRGASKITPRVEWEFVLHSAKLYDRMGCDLLGLDLVRNWEFQQPATAGFGGEVNPLKLLRRRSSLVVDDLPPPRRDFEMKPRDEDESANMFAKSAAKASAAVPPVFEEPDANSLLDSFGL